MSIIMLIQENLPPPVGHKVLTKMHATDGKVIIFPRYPLELLFQCVTVLSSFTLALVKCHQNIVHVNRAEAQGSSVFPRESPKAKIPEKRQSNRDEPSPD